MYRILSASKDTYITNKILFNKIRATDANTGQAGTLDLFKLYGESISGSNTSPTEISRILIYFNLAAATSMHNLGKIDVGDSSFKSYLKLSDVYGGQTTPSNFKIISFPLSKSFDEGGGYDIINFSDIDVANYVTASFANNVVDPWNLPGALKSGSLNDTNIDVIVSGTVAGQSSKINLSNEQLFKTGFEDLNLDVTSFVSASIKGLVDNHGFVVAYSGSYENDKKTYFVKRFASKDASNQYLRPKLTIEYNDAIIDNHSNIEFGSINHLYLNNFSKGKLANIVTGSSNSEVLLGDLMLKLVTGSYVYSASVTQLSRGESNLAGIYTASVDISGYETDDINGYNVFQHAQASGSITFDEIWTNEEETITFLSSSLTIKQPTRTALNYRENRYQVSMLNLKSRYKINDFVRLRVFVQNADREIVFTKKPLELPSEIFENMFYRVRDYASGKIIIPFKEEATKLGSDSIGMYFDFYMSSLPTGRSYVFDFNIKVNDFDIVMKDVASNFIVE
jgi:hypothetical protein